MKDLPLNAAYLAKRYPMNIDLLLAFVAGRLELPDRPL